jgi:transposase-like protein
MRTTIPQRTGRGLSGAPRFAKRWAPAALQAAVQAGLEHHRIFDVDVTDILTMRMAVATLVNHGVDVDDVARRLSLARNTVHVHLTQWRQKQGISPDAHRQLIADAKQAHRTGKALRQVVVPRGPTPEREVPPDLDPEVYEFMNTIFCASLQREHELQTGKTLTLAEVAALSQYEQDRLDRDANIRAASEGWRTRFGR